MKRMFIASLATETNTFSPIPTGPNVWGAQVLVHRGDPPDEAPPVVQGARAVLWNLAADRGWEIAEGLFAIAQPAGLTPRAYYEELRDELLSDLQAALPVDGVLLILHGAMVAEGYDDCEGDILSRVRELVGPDVPVGAELDLHSHITTQMLEHADVLVGYKEYPHVDVMQRMIDLFALVADAAEGKVRPVISTFDCRMVGFFHTTNQPMRALVDEFTALEQEDGILNVWLAHGFPYSDVPDIGATMVVVTDGDAVRGSNLAEQLGRKFFSLRDQAYSPPQTLDACLTQATSARAGPITIGDTADNAGGGAPSDSTFFLAEMIERGIENAAIGPLWDPVAVQLCQDGGLGARLKLRIGGKLGPSSGDPVDVEATVLGLSDQLANALNDMDGPLGTAAGIKVHLDDEVSTAPDRGIDVVLTSVRGQGYAPTIFSGVGIDPETKKILVVKSTQHFHAGFDPISAQLLYAGDLGALPGDMKAIPYERANTSRLWPFVEDPFANAQREVAD
jgi:microcystin degradation protein MlrC